MPRLGSKKSRNGCTQCKARRVKCDENRPCAACTRYRVECSLLASSGPGSSATASPGSQPSPESISDFNNTPTVTTPTVPSSSLHSEQHGLDTPSFQQHYPSQESWMSDLELMHHYTAHAYLTMPGVSSTRQIWGYSVPQEAFKFPFLMHSILAFSANHLAYLNPSRASHFRLLSGTHQASALTSLNGVLADIRPANCHAIFVSASLTVLNAFADARTFGLDVLIEIFQLIRGMDYVLNKTTPLIEKGPFAAILRPNTDPPVPPPLLSSFLVDLQATGCSSEGDATPVQVARTTATDYLRHALQYAIETSLHPALRAAMIWPIRIDADFMDLLKARSDAGVRDLFVRYCQLLEFASSDFWFLSGWRGISQDVW